ncbi:MAG: glycosyltransferase family 2 protein [Chloroflexota bacterium]
MIFIKKRPDKLGSKSNMSDKTVAEKRAAQSSVRSISQLDFMMAKAWLSKGKIDDARHRLEKILAVDPMHEGAYVELSKIYAHQKEWSALTKHCKAGLNFFPNRTELHKAHIQALRQSGGFEASCQAYGMVRIDDRQIELGQQDLIVCLGVKNEINRLPWYFDYYRSLGIRHFLAVDHYSEDGSFEFLLDQPDVYLWRSNISFNMANLGASWTEVLLQEYGIGRWCLIADADEILVFNDVGEKGDSSLAAFCSKLDSEGKMAASGLALEMYSNKPIQKTHCTPGKDFLKICPYFDREFFHELEPPGAGHRNQEFHWGGMRKRVFGGDVDYILTKTPLLKYQADTLIPSGFHYTNFPAEKIAHQGVCVLHFHAL